MSISGAWLLQEWINIVLVGIFVGFDKNVITWFQGKVYSGGPKADSWINVDDIEGSGRRQRLPKPSKRIFYETQSVAGNVLRILSFRYRRVRG